MQSLTSISVTFMKTLICCLLGGAVLLPAQSLDFLNRNQSLLDAHNCYPYEGQWADRIDRALKQGFPIGIEQDIAWAADPVTGKGRPVVTHTDKTTGKEPALRDHFFERVRPIIEKALAENRRDTWPLIVLHFDFKSLDPKVLRGVWDLLGEYQDWITTAPQTVRPSELGAFDAKPLLVLTEDADIQEQIFFREIPKGTRLRLFGSAATTKVEGKTAAERAHLAATMLPEKLLPTRATNFRRWWNNPWGEVEEGGQTRAGEWTPAVAARLKALVEHAHSQGYWIRFYTLDGFAPEADQGWGAPYNFGSKVKAEIRWKAALDVGVNLIATDQYEDLRAFMNRK